MLEVAILSSFLYSAEPNLHQKPYTVLESSCPAQEQIKPKLPVYGIENLVAEYYINLNDKITSYVVPNPEYTIHVYDSKSKNNKIIKPYDDIDFIIFLSKREFDIIRIYEDNKNIPSAIIHKNKDMAYILFNFDTDYFVLCINKWSPSLVFKTADAILHKRRFELKENAPPSFEAQDAEI